MPAKKSAEDRKSGRTTSPGKKVKEGAAGAASPLEPKKPKLAIWPEFNETDVNNEKWDSAHGGKAKPADKGGKVPQVAAPQYFDDPDGPLPLPNSLRPTRWQRPGEFFGEGVVPVVVDGENGGYFEFDLMSANEQVMHSELIRWIITQVESLFKLHAAKATGNEPAEVLVSPDGFIYNFRPWEHIYAINKVTKGPNIPAYNPYGKYVVKLFWMGQWRRIYVDDNLPLDENDKVLLPMSARPLELWPMLLCKAMIKVAALDYGGGSGTQEFGDFSPIHCLTGWLPQTIMVRKQSGQKIWEMLQKLLPEWKLPPSEKELKDSTDEMATPDPEKQQQVEAAAAAAAAPNAKGKQGQEKGKAKEDKKDKGKGDKAKEDTIIYENPEVVIFASYYDATRKQPLQVTSLADGANKSEQLRQRGFSYLYSHPVHLTQFRTCPLEAPKPPEPVPAWKLIRPRVNKPMPVSEAPRLGEGEGGGEEEEEGEEPVLIRAVEVASPFVNYKVDLVPLPQGTSRPCSSLSRRSTRPETPPNPKIEECDESAPDWDVQEQMRKLQEEEQRLRKEAEREAEEKRLKEQQEQLQQQLQHQQKQDAGDKSISKSAKGGGRSSQSKMESIDKSPANTTAQSVSMIEEAVEATKQAEENQVVEVPRKKWLDLDELLECFHCLHVYHKVHTYQHKHTFSDLKNVSSGGKDTRKSAGVSHQPPPTDERAPMYLMVDSLKPTEIIFSMSALSRWNDPPSPPTSNTPTAPLKSAREFSKTSMVEEPPRNETPGAGGDEAEAADAAANAAAADEQQVVEPLVPGSFISEFHSWKSLRMGSAFKRMKTTGTKAISLNLPPGRHVLKVFTKAPLGYFCKLVSASAFNFGSEEEILPLLQKEQPQRMKDYATRLVQSIGCIVANFSDVALRQEAEEQFWKLHCPFQGARKCDGRKHWIVFKQAFYQMLVKALEGHNPTPDMADAWRTFMRDATSVNPLQLSFAPKQKLQQDPDSWFNREPEQEHQIAATRVQKCLRGMIVRKMMRALQPDTKEHEKVVEHLRKAWSFMEPNCEQLGLQLLRNLFQLSPQTLQQFPFAADESNRLSYQDYSGDCPEQPANLTFLVFREVFHVPQDCAGVRILAKLVHCSVPSCCLRIIDNDTYSEFERSLGERMPSHYFPSNNLGYTVLGVARTREQPLAGKGKWKLRIIGDEKPLLAPARSDINCNFDVREVRNYYKPDMKRVIFRQTVKVTDDHLVTLHLKLSRLEAAVVLEVLDEENVMLSATGRGQVLIPAYLFAKDKVPEGQEDSLSESARSPSRQSGRAAKKRGSAKSKDGKLSHASSTSSLMPDGAGDTKPHKYIIQARLLDETWPLSPSNWAFVEQLREQEKEDMKVVGKPKEQVEEQSKPEAAAPTKKETPKAKAAKGKDAKGGKAGDKRGAGDKGDAGGSRPESAALDERKAHWVLRIISDSSQSEEIEVKPDTERLDSFRMHKRVWEDMEPGRAEKAKQSRLKYLNSHMIRNPEAPPTPEQPSAADDSVAEDSAAADAGDTFRLDDATSTINMPIEEPLTDSPPTPPPPKEMLAPLDLNTFRRGDEENATFKDFDSLKAEEAEVMKEKVAEFNKFLNEWEQKAEADKQMRNDEKKNYIDFVQSLQKLTDNYRKHYFRQRETYRQRCLEEERQKQQELAAKAAAEQEAAAAELEAAKAAAKGEKGKKASAKSPRGSAKAKGKKK